MHRCWCPGINLLVIHGHPLCSCPGSSPGVSLDLAVETNGDLKLPSQFSLVQPLSRVQLFATPWTAACQASLSITNSCSWSQWCHPTISSSVVPFSSCLQSFPASGSFQMSQFFPSGVQSIEISASASVLPMHIQDWFPLGWTGLISLQYQGLSTVFSNTTVQKHQLFGTQLSLLSNSHIHIWLLEKP